MSSDDDDKNGNKKSINITITADRPKVKRPPLYKVIMLNDDFTPMEFVVHVLKSYFANPKRKQPRLCFMSINAG